MFFKTGKSFKGRGLLFRWIAEGIGILLLIAYLFYNSLWVAILFSPYLFVYVKGRKRQEHIKREERAVISFKDGMQSVSAALTAGYSIENAFKESLSELQLLYDRRNPVYQGFVKMINRMALGVTVEEAFMGFAEEFEDEEIHYFAQVLSYAKRSGGNLVEIIRDTTEIISERIDVKREIGTIIASKKMEQKIMNLVPLGIILYMRLTSPGMMGNLYGNTVGIITMTGCLAVYIMGRFLAEKIADIRV